MPSSKKWLIFEMGTVPYQTAYRLQKQLAEKRMRRESDRNIILLLEHPPVFTTGKRGGRRNLLIDDALLHDKGIEVVATERGGDITYHGPGQLVGYVIADMAGLGNDIRGLVRSLEKVMTRTAADAGIAAGLDPENPGIWVEGRKLGAIGVAIRGGITLHGFSLNIDMDLSPFEWIHPCGLKGIRMTSLSELARKPINMQDIVASVRRHLPAVFGIEAEWIVGGP